MLKGVLSQKMPKARSRDSSPEVYIPGRPGGRLKTRNYYGQWMVKVAELVAMEIVTGDVIAVK